QKKSSSLIPPVPPCRTSRRLRWFTRRRANWELARSGIQSSDKESLSLSAHSGSAAKIVDLRRSTGFHRRRTGETDELAQKSMIDPAFLTTSAEGLCDIHFSRGLSPKNTRNAPFLVCF